MYRIAREKKNNVSKGFDGNEFNNKKKKREKNETNKFDGKYSEGI